MPVCCAKWWRRRREIRSSVTIASPTAITPTDITPAINNSINSGMGPTTPAKSGSIDMFAPDLCFPRRISPSPPIPPSRRWRIHLRRRQSRRPFQLRPQPGQDCPPDLNPRAEREPIAVNRLAEQPHAAPANLAPSDQEMAALIRVSSATQSTGIALRRAYGSGAPRCLQLPGIQIQSRPLHCQRPRDQSQRPGPLGRRGRIS